MYLGILSDTECYSWGQWTPVECPLKAFSISANVLAFYLNVKRFQGQREKKLITGNHNTKTQGFVI